jgi:hypothetical protein
LVLKYYHEENIVLHKYKAIYIVNAKVACTSIKFFLNELLNKQPVNVVEDIHHIHFPCVSKDELNTTYSKYFKFAFVRNPWDRVVSCYKNKIVTDTNNNTKPFVNGVFCSFIKFNCFNPTMSFEEFIECICTIPDNEADHHFKSQSNIITDHNNEVIPNFIGKLEKMQKDFDFVCNKIGVENTLNHHMKSDKQNYKEYYNDKTKQMISDRYKDDIDMFGYTF